MGTLAGLHIFAVKSMAGVEVSSARLTSQGLEGDRRYMVVDPDGRFVSQRETPQLGLIRATPVDGGGVRLSAASGELCVEAPTGSTRTVSVWSDAVEATDCGDGAAEFVSDALGRPARMVWFGPDAERAVDPRYAQHADRVGFADGFPVLVLSTSAVAALSARVGHSIDALRFRANLLVDGVPPHAEDDAMQCAIGSARLSLVKPCARCVMVDRDPITLEHDGRVLRELSSYRRSGSKVLFGMNATVLAEATLRVGDPVRFVPG